MIRKSRHGLFDVFQDEVHSLRHRGTRNLEVLIKLDVVVNYRHSPIMLEHLEIVERPDDLGFGLELFGIFTINVRNLVDPFQHRGDFSDRHPAVVESPIISPVGGYGSRIPVIRRIPRSTRLRLVSGSGHYGAIRAVHISVSISEIGMDAVFVYARQEGFHIGGGREDVILCHVNTRSLFQIISHHVLTSGETQEGHQRGQYYIFLYHGSIRS